MNLFRALADLSHLISIVILILKIRKTRSASGISFKTQVLYLIVFITRYFDLMTGINLQVYNSIMKVFFMASAGYILYLMKVRFKASWEPALDTFRIEFLIVPSALLAIFVRATTHHPILEYFWTFSIYLEAVAILPQLFQLQRTGEAETITTHYLAALGAYRGLYVLNWIFAYLQTSKVELIPMFAGILQTGIYLDFFYVYVTRVLQGQKFQLPQ